MLREEIKNIKSSTKILRNFGIILAIFLGILGGLSYWKEGASYPYCYGASLVVLVMSIISPTALRIIYWPWMVVATIIGWTMTRVVLIILYFVVFTPVSLILRIFGKDLLDQKVESERESYWNRREERQFSGDEFKQQF